MDFNSGIISVLFQLIFIECILSIDNAAVMGAMASRLPSTLQPPWPRFLGGPDGWLGRLLGSQQQAALRIGLFGAYAGRVLMLFLAAYLIEATWAKVLGAAYLIYLGVEHFGERYRHHQAEAQHGANSAEERTFWGVIIALCLADMAFSLDNVIAAAALSELLWVVLLGVLIGMLAIRFAAGAFMRLLAWEPRLEQAAYLLIVAIGLELLAETLFHLEIGDWTRFGISVGLIVLTLLFARVPFLARTLWIFRPLVWLCAMLSSAVGAILRVLTFPFRHIIRGAAAR